MANAVDNVLALPEVGVKQRLQDPYKMCRLCFQTPGIHDVSKAPLILQAIKQLYDVEVSCQHYSHTLHAFMCILQLIELIAT